MAAKPDIWSEWLLTRRTGGDPEMRRRVLESLKPVRDRVIDGANPAPGSSVLEVGCGDGMIGFGILEREPEAFVTFLDFSPALIETCQAIAENSGVVERCSFLVANAEDLSALPGESFDAVTLRSVLIYVPDKLKAHREFFRVLKRGGRLSYFEPINSMSRYGQETPDFFGYPAGPVQHLADKVLKVFAAIQGPGDPMLNFQERDLIDLAEDAGFEEVRLTVDFTMSRTIPPPQRLSWDHWLKQSGNPKIPAVGEAIRQALSPAELAEFEAHMRPQVESGRGLFRLGRAFMVATKGA